MRNRAAVRRKLATWVGSPRGRLYVRFATASGVSVLVGQAALALAFGVLHWAATLANLAAFVGGGVVSYTLNRRWTWQRRGRVRVLREIVPFWGIALAGLLASTAAVTVAEDVGPRLTDSRAVQTMLVMAASLAAFGSLWIVKFVAFDRYLFATAEQASAAARSDASTASSPSPSA